MRQAATSRKALHRLIDEVPDMEVGAAKRYLEYLRDLGDPVLNKLRSAPIDDEAETAEEARKVAQARRDLKRGKILSDAQVRESLGL